MGLVEWGSVLEVWGERVGVMEGVVWVWGEMLSVMGEGVGVLSRELGGSVEDVEAGGGERELHCSEVCLLLDGLPLGGNREGWGVRDGAAPLC